MKLLTPALLLALAVPAGAEDYSQLVPGTGISRSEAATLTLTEVAALRFNRGSRGDEQQAIVARSATVEVDPARHARLIAAAGLTPAEAAGMTLAEIAAAKHNAGTREDDRIVAAAGGAGEPGPSLVAAAGLDAGAAAGLILTEVAAIKFNRDTRSDDRQTTAH